MKKTALFLFAAIVVIAIGSGTAHADRGFWNYTTGGLETYINITNMDPTTAQIATVTFYAAAGGTALGSTTATIQPNGRWAFAASAAASPTTTVLNTNTNGTIVITGPTSCAGTLTGASSGTSNTCIHGYTTVATSGLSGFNFYFQSGSNLPAE